MSNLSVLREVVDLPPHYKVKLPAKERRAILKSVLVETRLRNALHGLEVTSDNLPQKPVQTGLTAWGSDRARITRCVKVFGPMTAREVSNVLGFTIRRAQQNISNLIVSGYLVKTGETRSVNGRVLQLLNVTPAGVKYGSKP